MISSDASSARDDNLDWTNPQCLLQELKNGNTRRKLSKGEELSKIRNEEDQWKLIRPTISKPHSEDKEEGENSNGRTLYH